MLIQLLKSKLHRATVTACELHYEGSCAIDETLLKAANIHENEFIHVWNINNGERFTTYAIKAPAGSGVISLNGSAARRASAGDLVIIATFAMFDEKEASAHQPTLVFLDEANIDNQNNKNNPNIIKEIKHHRETPEETPDENPENPENQ